MWCILRRPLREGKERGGNIWLELLRRIPHWPHRTTRGDELSNPGLCICSDNSKHEIMGIHYLQVLMSPKRKADPSIICSRAEVRELGSGSAGVIPTRLSSIPTATPAPSSWRVDGPRMAVPAPGTSAYTSSLKTSPPQGNKPINSSMPTAKTATKRRTGDQPRRKRRMERKNINTRKDKSNEFR
ncbi:hypothetical protein M413DRAFT_11081 [Hebeloma cylindrosporum]|uniref:Uncharacterized protein n=1 Tax=Hebeloma cylindrosporum TaxID=76867 RepID=A0A0C3CD45_HEBCY|nr:hypothetical protein M413DRAFT_11081 [Hebeloma cylindrosporum h7]